MMVTGSVFRSVSEVLVRVESVAALSTVASEHAVMKIAIERKKKNCFIDATGRG